MALKFSVSAPVIAPIPAAFAQSPPKAPDFRVSEQAARRIAAILAGEPAGSMLRVAVEGGGCSGFQYKFALTTKAQEDDLRIERDGVTVLVDPLSIPYLAGAELDFVTELMGQSFQVKNPNATASCGCGTSFSL